MAGIGIVNSTQNNINISQSRVEAQPVAAVNTVTAVVDESQDAAVNLNTSQTQQDQGDDQYSHQRYVALHGYITFGKDESTVDSNIINAGIPGTGASQAVSGGGRGAASEAAAAALAEMMQPSGSSGEAEQAATVGGPGAASEAAAKALEQMTQKADTSVAQPQGRSSETPAAQTAMPGAAAPATGTQGTDSEEEGEEPSKAVDDKGRPVDQTSEKKNNSTSQKKGANGEELTEEELQEVRDMEARHEEVRIHEMAHKSAGGQYAGSPTYSYETGPDGKRYITSGEVSIDIGEESDPQATIEKMQIVKRAAMAPAEPSAQDRKVYQEANQKEARARQQLAEETKEKNQERLDSAKSALRGENTTSADKTREAKEAHKGEEIDPSEIKPPKGGTTSRSLENNNEDNVESLISG